MIRSPKNEGREWDVLYGHGEIVVKQVEMTAELLEYLKSLEQVPPLDAAI